MQNKRFLQHLADVLNKVFKTESFELTSRSMVHIYSPELGIGVNSIVGDPHHLGEMSISDLFSRIEMAVKELKKPSLPLERLIIISTNNEEDLITNFIDFLRQREDIKPAIEFWGWETIQKIFQHFPVQLSDVPNVGDEQYLNFVPTANIYQLFGIEKILIQIDEAVDSSLTPVVIHNPLSGTGKTAILLAYAFHYDYQKKFDHYGFVGVTGNLKLSFVTSFNGQIGFSYNPLVSLEENLSRLIEMLNKVEGRNLLLVDGIDDVEQSVDLMRIAYKLRWKVLVTSRFRIYSFENIYLPYPEPEDAVKIFTYYFKDLEVSESVTGLLDKISYHPFMTVFLARFLSHYVDRLSVNDLLKMLEDRDSRVYHLGDYLDRRLSKNQILHMRSLLKYIMAIFDYQARDFTQLEKQILLIASVLPDRFTTFTVLGQIMGVEDDDGFADTVLMILSKGWLEADKDKFRVPRLVRAVLHKKFKPSPVKLRRYIEFLFSRLSQPTSEAMMWMDYASALVHQIVKLNIDVANIALLLAQHFDNLGEEKNAVENYEYAGYIIEQIYNETADEALLDPLANVWARVGRTERALFYAEQILRTLENEQEQSEELVFWYQFIASLYLRLDNFEKAISYADNALDMATMIFEKDDPRLFEIEEFHRQLSQEFNKSFINNEKKQWLRRFFI